MRSLEEFIILCVLFSLGAPLNIYAAVILWCPKPLRAKFACMTQPSVTKDMEFQRQRNLADLLVIFVYTCTRLALNLTDYQWLFGGRVMCKLTQYGSLLAWHAVSNITLWIALDRLITTVNHHNPHMRRMLIFAWLAALISSVPQFFIWDLFHYDKRIAGTNLTGPIRVCQSIWKNPSQNMLAPNSTLNQTSTPDVVQIVYYYSHLLLVFWVPFSGMVVCYTITTIYVCRKGGSSLNSSLAPQTIANLQVAKLRYRVFGKASLLVFSYCICWLPYNLITVVDSLQKRGIFYLHYIMIGNSLLNPLIVFTKNPYLRSRSASKSRTLNNYDLKQSNLNQRMDSEVSTSLIARINKM